MALSFRFLADMGIATSTLLAIRERGYDVVHLRERGLQRLSDRQIVALALSEQRIVLTLDKDFGSIVMSHSGAAPTVILFRLRNERPSLVTRRLLALVVAAPIDWSEGALITVEESRYRVRRRPQG